MGDRRGGTGYGDRQRDRHVRGPRLREQHPSPALYQETGFIVRYGTVQGRLRIGLPSSVQQCAISLGLIALLGIVNSFGTDTLTAYGAAGKIDTIIIQAVLTLSGALAAFCGQNIGAGHLDRVRDGGTIRHACQPIAGSSNLHGHLFLRGQDDAGFHQGPGGDPDWQGIFIDHGRILYRTRRLERLQRGITGSWRYPVPNGSKHHLSLADTHSPRLLV